MAIQDGRGGVHGTTVRFHDVVSIQADSAPPAAVAGSAAPAGCSPAAVHMHVHDSGAQHHAVHCIEARDARRRCGVVTADGEGLCLVTYWPNKCSECRALGRPKNVFTIGISTAGAQGKVTTFCGPMRARIWCLNLPLKSTKKLPQTRIAT